MLLHSKNRKSYDVAYKVGKNPAGKSVAISVTVPPWVWLEVKGNTLRLKNRTGIYHLFDAGQDEVVLPKNLMESLMNRIGKDLVSEKQ